MGRPAIAWAPAYTTNQTIGHLYLHYVATDGVVRWMSTYTSGVGSAAVQRIGLLGAFNNNWADQRAGVESMQEIDVGSNLRVIIAKIDGSMILYPIGDGISDFPLANHNDWAVFRTSLCRTLMYPSNALDNDIDPLVSSPIRCEPAPPYHQ
jgi:hypothetical protein